MTDTSSEEGNLDIDIGTHEELHVKTQRHTDYREGGHVKMESEIGVMLLQARGHHPGLTRSWKGTGRILPWRLWRECGPANILILNFQPPEL